MNANSIADKMNDLLNETRNLELANAELIRKIRALVQLDTTHTFIIQDIETAIEALAKLNHVN